MLSRYAASKSVKARRRSLSHTLLPFAPLLATLPCAVFAQSASAPSKPKIQTPKWSLPLAFEAAPAVSGASGRFVAHGAGYALTLSPTQAVFAPRRSTLPPTSPGRASAPLPVPTSRLPIVTPPYRSGKTIIAAPPAAKTEKQGDKKTRDGRYETAGAIQNRKSKIENLTMSLSGANPTAPGVGAARMAAVVNEYIGKDPKRWRTGVPLYARAEYRGVYPGVNVVYYGNGRQLEYDFVVRPHANPKPIELAFHGAKQVTLAKNGDLELTLTGGGPLVVRKPVVYQTVNGRRSIVNGAFALRGRNHAGECRVGFALANYDRSRSLVIDPVVVYATYLGGSGYDEGHAVAADANGNAVFVGQTNSVNFPGRSDGATRNVAYAVGFNAGGGLRYITLLGGSSNDTSANAVALDSAGSAYVTGQGYSDFPTTPDAYTTPSASIFLARLNTTGALTYGGTYGAYSDTQASDIGLDSAGNVYLGGATSVPRDGFPATPNAYQMTRRTNAAFRSRGGDFYWRDLHSGLDTAQRVNAYAFGTPDDGSIVYAATDLGVFKSSDGGDTWNTINGTGDGGQLPAAEVTSLLYINDSGLSPDAVLLAGVTNSDSTVAGVYQSHDDGATWQRTDNGDSPFQNPVALAHPIGSPYFYIGDSQQGVFANDLTTTVSLFSGLPDSRGTAALIYDPIYDALYAGVSGQGVYSLDVSSPAGLDDLQGRTWQNRNGTGATALPNQNGSGPNVFSLLSRPSVPFDAANNLPQQPSRVYAGLQGGAFQHPGGIYFSEDGGATWQQDVGPGGGVIYLNQYDIRSLAYDPAFPRQLYVGTTGGLVTGTENDISGYPGLGFLNTFGLYGGYHVLTTAVAPGGRSAPDPDPNAKGKTYPIVFSGVDKSASDSFSYHSTAMFVGKFDLTRTGQDQLVYSTLFGGSQPPTSENIFTFGGRMAVQADGTVLLAGTTDATDLPTTPGVVSPTFRPGDIGASGWVAKFDPNQSGDSSLVYSTFLGGTNNNDLTGLAVDSAGQAIVAGRSTYDPAMDAAHNFPVTSGAFRTDAPGFGDFEVVAQLNATADALAYGTYLPGSATHLVSPATDATGKIYLAGEAYFGIYTDLPRVNSLPGAGGGQGSEPFMMLLNPAGTGDGDILFSSTLGGSAVSPNAYTNGRANGVAVGAGGSFFLTGGYFAGGTNNSQIPTLTPVNAFQGQYGGGGSDAFAARVNLAAVTPRITAISPASAPAGSGATVVTLTGSNFAQNSVALVNGAARATSFVSATQIRVTLTAADLATAGTRTLTVTTPGASAPSNAQIFTVTAVGAPKLTFTNLALTRVNATTVNLTLTISNAGTGAATSVQVKSGTYTYTEQNVTRTLPLPGLPITVGTVAAGATSATVTIPLGNIAAGTAVSVSLKGSAANAGTFTGSRTLTAP